MKTIELGENRLLEFIIIMNIGFDIDADCGLMKLEAVPELILKDLSVTIEKAAGALAEIAKVHKVACTIDVGCKVGMEYIPTEHKVLRTANTKVSCNVWYNDIPNSWGSVLNNAPTRIRWFQGKRQIMGSYLDSVRMKYLLYPDQPDKARAYWNLDGMLKNAFDIEKMSSRVRTRLI